MTIETFLEKKKKYENAVRMVDDTRKDVNSLIMHKSGLNDIYHEVAFSFSIKSGGSHRYEGNEELARCIGKACDALKYTIVDRALDIFRDELIKTANGARKEALEVLETLKDAPEELEETQKQYPTNKGSH